MNQKNYLIILLINLASNTSRVEFFKIEFVILMAPNARIEFVKMF